MMGTALFSLDVVNDVSREVMTTIATTRSDLHAAGSVRGRSSGRPR
jgi:hypothetical protein